MALDEFPPYDENVVAKQLTQIFEIFHDLCYISNGDLIFPPVPTSSGITPRHDFSLSTRNLFSELNFSEEIISLLTRIPYIREQPSDEYYMYTADTTLYCFTNEGYARPARYIDDGSQDEACLLGSTEIALAVPRNREGFTLVLDVSENSIRVHNLIDHEDTLSSREHLLLYPGKRNYYKNSPPIPAPHFLQEYISDLRTLKCIPYVSPSEGRAFMYAPPIEITADMHELCIEGAQYRSKYPTKDDEQYSRLKHILTQSYGWPDNFNKAKWATDHDWIWESVQEGYMPPREDVDERTIHGGRAQELDKDSQILPAVIFTLMIGLLIAILLADTGQCARPPGAEKWQSPLPV